jgi:pSer/pThr/pTyr-binding forkhead associated (FHA) protein
MRFCVACGGLLAAPPPAQAAPRPARPPIDLSRTVPDPPSFNPALLAAAAQPPPAAPSAPVIAPGRVMDLGTPPPQAFQRLCARCRGACDATSQFCRFCGASLADAQAFPLQPAPNPIAAAPAPAPAVVAPAASTTRARLVLIARDGGEGPSFPLGESTDIGRSEGNVVIADDRYISPRHARITLRQGAFYLRDLESTNGMYVRIPFPRQRDAAAPVAVPLPTAGAENQASAEQILTDQDLFLVGQQVLRFEVVKNAEEGFGVASENGTLLFGTPAAPRYARLSQRTVEGVVRDVFHVRKAETVIGREQGDIVFNDDPFLSRRHCVLRVSGGGSDQGPRSFTLADLGSSNGTFLQVREEVRLRHGDHFRIGQQLFRFDT